VACERDPSAESDGRAVPEAEGKLKKVDLSSRKVLEQGRLPGAHNLVAKVLRHRSMD
jgi:hypothetical protein